MPSGGPAAAPATLANRAIVSVGSCRRCETGWVFADEVSGADTDGLVPCPACGGAAAGPAQHRRDARPTAPD